MHKFPRTPHVKGSRFQTGDHDLEAIQWKELSSKYLIVEEKLDGSQVGISFDDDGTLLLQSRGHYLRGGPREKEFEPIKTWAACHQQSLRDTLGTRYVMYGENMYAKHTCFYDALPHYFMEFDVLDTETSTFLSTDARKKLLTGLPIKSVLVVHEGHVSSMGSLAGMITRSNFITNDRAENLKLAAMNAGVDPNVAFEHTDLHDEMEGLYIKWEEDGVVKGRYKFVRSSFTNSIIEQEQHWHDRPIIANKLSPGAYDRMFE